MIQTPVNLFQLILKLAPFYFWFPALSWFTSYWPTLLTKYAILTNVYYKNTVKGGLYPVSILRKVRFTKKPKSMNSRMPPLLLQAASQVQLVGIPFYWLLSKVSHARFHKTTLSLESKKFFLKYLRSNLLYSASRPQLVEPQLSNLPLIPQGIFLTKPYLFLTTRMHGPYLWTLPTSYFLNHTTSVEDEVLTAGGESLWVLQDALRIHLFRRYLKTSAVTTGQGTVTKADFRNRLNLFKVTWPVRRRRRRRFRRQVKRLIQLTARFLHFSKYPRPFRIRRNRYGTQVNAQPFIQLPHLLWLGRHGQHSLGRHWQLALLTFEWSDYEFRTPPLTVATARVLRKSYYTTLLRGVTTGKVTKKLFLKYDLVTYLLFSFVSLPQLLHPRRRLLADSEVRTYQGANLSSTPTSTILTVFAARDYLLSGGGTGSSTRPTLTPWVLANFQLPTYGYLYLTPTLGVFSNNRFLRLKVQFYSFAFFNDIKLFYIATYNPNKTFLNDLTRPRNETFDFYNLRHFGRTLPVVPDSAQLNSTPGGITLNYGQGSGIFVKRIRFKPGYSKIWRSARSALKLLLGLSFVYQQQLTKFIFKFYKLAKLTLLQYYELKLPHVLVYMHMAPDVFAATALVTNGLIFVNARNCLNPTVILFKNDLIQIFLTLKYYVLFKWLLNNSEEKRTRFLKFLYVHRVKLAKGYSGLINTRFPKWLLSILFFFSDVPKYLEVDFFTLSGLVLLEPFYHSDFNPSNWTLSKYNIMSSYNWKYIT